MKLKLVFVLVLCLSVLCVGVVSASDVNADMGDNAIDEVVDLPAVDESLIHVNVVESNDDSVNFDGSFSELQDLINSNSVVNLDKDYSFVSGDSMIKVSKDLTINGNGHSLNGAGMSKIMEIERGHVILNNIEFKNGFAATGVGAALYSWGDVEINKCVFKDNCANTGNGGAIYANGALIISNSKFIKNHAYEDGGAIYCNSAHIVDTIFSDNEAKGSSSECFGGAITSLRVLYIEGCEFKSNYAEDCGGAIYAGDILFCGENTFIGNIAENHGGAVYTDTITGNVEYVTFKNNQAKTNDGGALYINKEYDGTIQHCYFEGNSAIRGGAIYIDSVFSDLTVTMNAFIGNTATSGKSGFASNSLGWRGIAFKIGPNWYGDTNESSRKGQFCYKGFDFIHYTNYEQEVDTWLSDLWSIFDDPLNDIELWHAIKDKVRIYTYNLVDNRTSELKDLKFFRDWDVNPSLLE